MSDMKTAHDLKARQYFENKNEVLVIELFDSFNYDIITIENVIILSVLKRIICRFLKMTYFTHCPILIKLLIC